MEVIVAAEGQWGRVIWALDPVGQARAFLRSQPSKEQDRVWALFGLLAEKGWIGNDEKFKFVSVIRGERLFEFKSGQLRFLGAFRPGKYFVLAFGVRKKQDKHRPKDLETTAALLKDHDQQRK